MATAGGHLSMDLDGDFDDGDETPNESSSLEEDDTTPDGLSNSSDAVGVAYMHSSGSGDDDGTPVESFPDDEQEAADTTAAQFYREGRDLQGIPWERLQVSRAEYRLQRVQHYRNYMNCIPEDDCAAIRAELTAAWPQPQVLVNRAWPYHLLRNWRAVASSIVHFQLRNLLWAVSAQDVVVVYDNRVQHFNNATRAVCDVLDLRGWPKGPRLPGVGRVQVSTLCVREGLVAAGGFSGELVLASMQRTEQGIAWGDTGDEVGTQQQQQQQQEEEEEEEEDPEGGCYEETRGQGQAEASEQQQQQQQAVFMQQQVLSAAKQMFPGAQHMQHAEQQQQQQHSRARPQRDMQQHHHNHHWSTCTLPLPCTPMIRGGGAAHMQQGQHHKRLPHVQQQQQQEPEPLRGAAGPAAARVLHCCRVTQSENGITNGIEIFDSVNYGHCVMTSNNDCCVRLFDVEGCRPRQRLPFSFAVNYATLRPAGAAPGGGALAAVVGDDPLTWLVDIKGGVQVTQLGGHRDFSFAAAWHPSGHLLATGNQDSTTRVWDLRSPSEPLAVLGGALGAIRSLRFSPDGSYLAAAEPADFVHIYDVQSGFSSVQEVDLFGEVAGMSFSPDSRAFFVSISDTLYNSLVQYHR